MYYWHITGRDRKSRIFGAGVLEDRQVLPRDQKNLCLERLARNAEDASGPGTDLRADAEMGARRENEETGG